MHRLEVGVSRSVLSLVLPPLHKTWQELQVLQGSGGVDVLFRMWILLSCFQLWSLANHSGKNALQLLIERDEMASLSMEGEMEKGLAPFVSCGPYKGGDC